MSVKHLLVAGGVLGTLLTTAPAGAAPTPTTATAAPTTATATPGAATNPTATPATATTPTATPATTTATPATTTATPATPTATPATATAAPATAAPATVSAQDVAFLQAAHQSNLAEIAGGGIAADKGATAQVRDLGARFVRDHTALDATVTATAAVLGVALPSAPTPAQLALAERYRTTPPAEFDALFVTTQLQAHHAAMERGRTELANGSDARAKQVASSAAPVIAAHHGMLRAAQRALGLGYGTPAR